MRYSYCLNTLNATESVVDEALGRMAQQARISTRRRSYKWDLKVHAEQIKIRFLHMADRDDFLDAFDSGNKEVLKRHGFAIGGQANARLFYRAERFLLPLNNSSKK